MSRLKTISDKLDYIAMGKLNAEQMEYICEINQEVNLKDREIEILNKSLEEQRHFYLEKLQQKENIIKEVREYIKEHPWEEEDGFQIENVLEILDKEVN